MRCLLPGSHARLVPVQCQARAVLRYAGALLGLSCLLGASGGCPVLGARGAVRERARGRRLSRSALPPRAAVVG